MTYHVDFKANNSLFAELTFDVRELVYEMYGGDRSAEIDVFGQEAALLQLWRLINKEVVIKEETRSVFHGRVIACHITLEYGTVSYSMKELVNRVMIHYNERGAFGSDEKGQTGWYSDQDSIESYGIHEEKISASEVHLDELHLIAEKFLSENSSLIMSVEIFKKKASGARAELEVEGISHDLRRRFYFNDEGRLISGEESIGSHIIGLNKKYSSSAITFDDSGTITDENGGFAAFRQGLRLSIGGSLSNDGVIVVESWKSENEITVKRLDEKELVSESLNVLAAATPDLKDGKYCFTCSL